MAGSDDSNLEDDNLCDNGSEDKYVPQEGE